MRRATSTAAGICVALLALCFALSCPAARADDAGNLDPGWSQSVLELRINGVRSSEDVVALRDASGGLWLAEADFTRLRLRLPHVAPHVTDGRSYLPVAGIRGAKLAFDTQHAAVNITLPADAFESSAVQFNGGPRPPLSRSGTGAFLNYQLYGQTGQYAGADAASAYAELGIFNPLGMLDNTAVESASNGLHTFVRLETTFNHDFPDELETLRLGDDISVPGSWAEAVRFGGLQWGTNYAIRPDLVTTPLLAAAGTAVVPSTVDVFINGKAVGSSQVPAGPFVVNQVPALNGAGDVTIVVKNALGQEQVVSVPFYSAPVMLQSGLSLFDIDVGPLRENYGLASDDYGPLLASGTWRHGFTELLTGEAHAEWLRDGPQAAGIDIAQALDHWAVVTLDLAEGGQPANAGVLGGPPQLSSSGTYEALGIQHADAQFSFLLQAQHASAGFREAGDYGSIEPPPLERNIAQLGWSLGRAGSVQAAFVGQRNFDDTRQQTLALTYQVNIGRGNLSATVSRTTGDTPDTNASVFYVLPLDSRRNTTTQLRYDTEQPTTPNAALVQTLQKTVPIGAGDGYLLSAGTDGSYETQYTRQTDAITLQATAARFADQSAQNLAATGGLTYMDGELHAARTISDSFATVEVGGIPNVTVYLDNQPIAQTDSNGQALVPYLRSFDVNRLSIDPLQLPLDAAVNDPQVQIVPPYRSGVLVSFPVKRERSGVFKLKRADGSAVPAGATVRFQGQDFPVGLDGLTYVIGYDHGTSGEARWNGGQCTFRLPPPPDDQPQPDLGTIACRSTP
ncbi:MAG: fimbria/pilus outer membrane usher protein [Steroidobacteraceae bacterium]